MPIPPRHLAPAMAALLACFLALDACWLTFVGPHLYRPALDAILAPRVDGLAAVLFYLVYFLGLAVFVVAPELAQRRPDRALARGALFGLVAYGTYDLTNQATLSAWSWSITAADLSWGAIVSGASSWAAVRTSVGPRGLR